MTLSEPLAARPPPSPADDGGGFYGLGATFLVLAAVTLARLVALALGDLDLHPDEAQYWSWSRDPAWGYFSKPPMVGWLIAAAGLACGADEACIRAPIPLLHMMTALAVYGIGQRLYDRRVGWFAAVAFVTLPGVAFSANVASTDPPLMTFWAVALYALVRLMQGPDRPRGWWIVLGAAVGLGLMSKYAMAFFVVGVVFVIALDADARRRLIGDGAGRSGLAIAAVLAFVIYLPNFIWNVQQGFVTFVHTGANANLGGDLFHPAELAAFVGAQFGVFGPILFAVLIWLAVRVGVWRPDARTRLLAAFVLPMLLTILVLSLISRANANWAAPVYVAATVWVSAALLARAAWLARASLVVNGAVALVLLLMPAVLSAPGVYAGLRLPGGTDPFASYHGWRGFGKEIGAIRAHYPGVPLLVDDRKLTAAMLYYVAPRMGDIFAWHPGARVDDHFKLTRPLPDRPGGDFLLVARFPDVGHILSRFTGHSAVAMLAAPGSLGDGAPVRVIHLRGFLGYKAPRP